MIGSLPHTNRNLQQRSTNQLMHLPQVALKHALSEVILAAYGLNWTPRAVRQHRTVKAGSLAYVDYAIPCFELAQTLQLSPVDVATKLAFMLSAQTRDTASGAVLLDAQFEAVSGYINICLSEVSIKVAINAAARWFNKPTSRKQAKSYDTLLVLGPRLDYHESFALTDKALQYIDHCYDLLGKNHETNFLISDYSEYMVDHLTAAVSVNHELPVSGIEFSKLNREVRNFLTDQNRNNTHITRSYSKLRSAWVAKRKRVLSHMELNHSYATYESKLTKHVHHYLDSQPISKLRARGIIADPNSKAVYFEEGLNVYPVRSAAGLLYSLSYILYQLETVAQSMRRSPSKSLVVIAPHKMHFLIHTFVRLSIPTKSMPDRVICFDPTNSKADILAMSGTVPSIEGHFSTIETCLQNMSPYWLSNQHKRQTLLALVDLPVQLSESVNRIQLPSLFDAVSSSVESLTILSS